MNVEKKFLQCIKDFNLISENDKILVAYSTGADSSALAFLLTKLKEYLKIGKIALAYLNHSIRKESDEEEIFAKQFAEKLG
ncbi:cell cycle protein MesJ, partial [Hydrogenivirga sp. 128-5-R1-1]